MTDKSKTRNNYTLTEFGLKVKKRLIDLGMTQKQFAKKIGVGEVYLAVVLHGRRSGDKYVNRIKDFLDIN